MTPADGYRAVGLAAGLTVVALLVDQMVSLLLGVVIALILAIPLSAAADHAQRLGLPRIVGALVAAIALLAVVIGFGFALVPAFVDQAKEFAQRLPTLVDSVTRQLGAIKGVHTQNLSHSLSGLIDTYISNPQRLFGPVAQVGSAALVIVGGAVLVIAGAFTLAVNPEPIVDFVLRVVPAAHRPVMHDVIGRVREAWLGWMTAVAIDMVVLGTLLWLGMVIVGLPFAIGFATFSALMTVIPNYGSIISAIPPILAGLAQSPGQAALVLVVYVVVNQIEGNVLLPLIMARTVDMHPAVVAIGLLVMAALFGVIGVFIAIPLISLTMILVQALWIEPQEAAAKLAVELPPGSAASGRPA